MDTVMTLDLCITTLCTLFTVYISTIVCVSVCLRLFVCDCVLINDTMKKDISGVMEGTDLPQKKKK